MFWNPFKKTKAPYEEPVKPQSAIYVLSPQPDMTVMDLIALLQHYIPGQGPVIPSGPTEIPVDALPSAVMRHMKFVRPV